MPKNGVADQSGNPVLFWRECMGVEPTLDIFAMPNKRV